MKKRFAALFLMVVFAVTLLAGCGGGEEAAPAGEASKTEASSKAESSVTAIAKVRDMPEVSGDPIGTYAVAAKYGARLYYELGGGNSGGICIIDNGEEVQVYQAELFGKTLWGLISYNDKTGWLILEGEDPANWQ